MTMNTKYIDYLQSRGWQFSTVGQELTYSPPFHVALEGVSLELYGWGKTADLALADLESKCQAYITEVERNLNLELVQ
jgi:hypothetical protein